MRLSSTLVLFSLFCLQASAQTPVAQPLIPWLNNSTALPQTVAEVKSKCYITTDGSYDLNRISGPLPKRIGETIQKINQTDSVSYTMPDTAGIADVQKMTPAQQQAWAAQYAMKQQAAAAGSTVLPSSAETSFNAEYTSIIQRSAVLVDSMNRQFDRLLKENDAKQIHFEQQREEMIKICPIINYGGGQGGPDPTCVTKAEANYREWEAAWATEWFGKVGALLSAKKNEMRALYSKGETMLVNNNYFLHPTSAQYTKDAASFQLLELNFLMAMESIIEKTWSVGTDIDRNIHISHDRCGEPY